MLSIVLAPFWFFNSTRSFLIISKKNFNKEVIVQGRPPRGSIWRIPAKSNRLVFSNHESRPYKVFQWGSSFSYYLRKTLIGRSLSKGDLPGGQFRGSQLSPIESSSQIMKAVHIKFFNSTRSFLIIYEKP